jgi:replication initiation and membrane attachment protein DnaB
LQPTVNPIVPPDGAEIKRIARRTMSNLSTPSIKDALEGKFEEKQLSAKEQHQIYSKEDDKEEFTVEELKEKWNTFLQRLDDRPNLQSTLSNPPELKEDFQMVLEIENTVQEDLIGTIKPELVSWLRKELKNSKIQLTTQITEKVKGRLIYSDAEKYDELLKKNPSLALLRKKFNLDFGQ